MVDELSEDSASIGLRSLTDSLTCEVSLLSAKIFMSLFLLVHLIRWVPYDNIGEYLILQVNTEAKWPGPKEVSGRKSNLCCSTLVHPTSSNPHALKGDFWKQGPVYPVFEIKFLYIFYLLLSYIILLLFLVLDLIFLSLSKNIHEVTPSAKLFS